MGKKEFLERIQEGIIIGDGAMGTMLQGLSAGTDITPEQLMLEQPELILDVHKEYLAAGAELIETNTFGANGIKLASIGLGDRSQGDQ